MAANDHRFMRQALELAARAQGRTSPNPMVGAVIVRDGLIVGRGFHARAGAPHAEIGALEESGQLAKGATMYVTLEPCCHRGRTGPCSEAVIAAGIKRVVMAMQDPNPQVSGGGAQRLAAAGIEVTQGILEQEARRLNEVFIKYIRTGLPFVALKTATSLDGKIATASGESKWITGSVAREFVHRLRDRYDAILVGIGTILADDPALTTRLPQGSGQDPVRVILDSRARTPLDAKVIKQDSGAVTMIVTAQDAPLDKVRQLQERGAKVLILPGHANGIDLTMLLSELGRLGISSLLLEGGGKVNSSFIEHRLVDKIYWFLAPKLIGGHGAPGALGGQGLTVLAEAPQIQDISIHRYGEDICLEGYLAK